MTGSLKRTNPFPAPIHVRSLFQKYPFISVIYSVGKSQFLTFYVSTELRNRFLQWVLLILFLHRKGSSWRSSLYLFGTSRDTPLLSFRSGLVSCKRRCPCQSLRSCCETYLEESTRSNVQIETGCMASTNLYSLRKEPSIVLFFLFLFSDFYPYLLVYEYSPKQLLYQLMMVGTNSSSLCYNLLISTPLED